MESPGHVCQNLDEEEKNTKRFDHMWINSCLMQNGKMATISLKIFGHDYKFHGGACFWKKKISETVNNV